MSHKSSKRIRRVLRAQRINPDERSYDIVEHVCGDPKKPYRAYQVVLTKGAGRDLYQRAKREMKS